MKKLEKIMVSSYNCYNYITLKPDFNVLCITVGDAFVKENNHNNIINFEKIENDYIYLYNSKEKKQVKAQIPIYYEGDDLYIQTEDGLYIKYDCNISKECINNMEKKFKILECVVENIGGRIDGSLRDDYFRICLDNPEGEDFGIEVENLSVFNENCSVEDFSSHIVEQLYRKATDFDIDDYVEMWIEAKRNGCQGIPTARGLVYNAEYLEEKLQELYQEVRKVF